MKIILIIVAILVVIFVLMLATCGMALHHFGRQFRTRTDGKHTTVTTPFGNVTTDEGDANKTAADLGVDVYPGAKARKSSSMNIGKMSVQTAEFETDDSVAQVGEFYRSHMPNATMSNWQDNEGTIVAQTSKGMLTVTVRREGDATHITLSGSNGIPGLPTGK